AAAAAAIGDAGGQLQEQRLVLAGIERDRQLPSAHAVIVAEADRRAATGPETICKVALPPGARLVQSAHPWRSPCVPSSLPCWRQLAEAERRRQSKCPPPRPCTITAT